MQAENQQSKQQREAAQIAKAQRFLDNYRRWSQMALLFDDEIQMSAYSDGARFSMQRHQESNEAQACRQKANLVNFIVEQLPFCDYLVIHYHYIIGLSIDRALDSIHIDRSTAYRRQRRGLLRIAQIMDELHCDEGGNRVAA